MTSLHHHKRYVLGDVGPGKRAGDLLAANVWSIVPASEAKVCPRKRAWKGDPKLRLALPRPGSPKRSKVPAKPRRSLPAQKRSPHPMPIAKLEKTPAMAQPS